MRNIVLVAASGLALETAEAAGAAGDRVVGCVDDDSALHGRRLRGWLPVLGGLDRLAELDADHVVCAGKGATRAALVRRLAQLGRVDDRAATVADPRVLLPRSSTIGAGSILLAGTVLTAQVQIGRHVVCMPQVTLTHDDVIEDFATVCAGVTLGGGVRVGARAYLGMNASVRENACVGSDSVVGMGSVVLRDVPDGQVWAGVPARKLNVASESRQMRRK